MSKFKTIEKITPKLLNHFKAHWYKWLLTGVALGLAFSGYSCTIGDNIFKKTAPLKEHVKNEISNTV